LASLHALKEMDASSRELKELDAAEALALREPLLKKALSWTREALGADRKTFVGEVFKDLAEHRMALWQAEVKNKINWELFDCGIEAYTRFTVEELAKAAGDAALLSTAPRGAETTRFAQEAVRVQLAKKHDQQIL